MHPPSDKRRVTVRGFGFTRIGGRLLWLVPFACLCGSASAASVRSETSLAGVVSVIDADTLNMHGQRIRPHGIDAPESRQLCEKEGTSWRCGQQAALVLSNHIGRKTVRCEQKDIDRYKRIVAICHVGSENINAWLVRQGWAMAYRQYSKDYIEQEAAARREKLGIWSGVFQPPWEWRRKPKAASPKS